MMRTPWLVMAVMATGCHRVTFEVEGTQAWMYGTINTSTPQRVATLLEAHPDLELIVMEDVPGSVDDDACLEAGRLIRAHGLRTHVPAHGEIASGGVDFFLAGVERTVADGGQVGVHSWSQWRGPDGDELDQADPAHMPYLKYLDSMGVDRSFYWFTLSAAAPDDIHWMTPEEQQTYEVITASSGKR